METSRTLQNTRCSCPRQKAQLPLATAVWLITREPLPPPRPRHHSSNRSQLKLGTPRNAKAIARGPLGPYLPGRSCLLTEAPGLASCSATLRVFDKLSWTLHVVECQFVKYPKCGICLTAPSQSSWDTTNKLPAEYKITLQTQTKLSQVIFSDLRELKHCI